MLDLDEIDTEDHQPRNHACECSTIVPALIDELRKLRESSEKLLDLNFGFMEQNRKLREENARLKAQVEVTYCPSDHAIMYANGFRSCGNCPWPLPKPPEVTS